MTVLLDLRRVFLNENTVMRLRTDVAVSEAGADVAFEGETVAADIKVENRAGFVEFTADVSFICRFDCDRCASPVSRNFHFQFRHTLVPQLSEESGDDYIEAPDYKLDTDTLLRDDILLALPSKRLCKESCKGLCPKCGKNLNEGSCGCALQEADPRLAALKKLLEQE